MVLQSFFGKKIVEFIKQQAELEQLVHDILKEARQQGADQAEVSVSAGEGLGVSVQGRT